MKSTVHTVASYLEQRIGHGWEASVQERGDSYDKHVVLTLVLSQQAIQQYRQPLDFLFSITPDKKVVEQALKNRTGHNHIGPYASRAILRRKVGL